MDKLNLFFPSLSQSKIREARHDWKLAILVQSHVHRGLLSLHVDQNMSLLDEYSSLLMMLILPSAAGCQLRLHTHRYWDVNAAFTSLQYLYDCMTICR